MCSVDHDAARRFISSWPEWGAGSPSSPEVRAAIAKRCNQAVLANKDRDNMLVVVREEPYWAFVAASYGFHVIFETRTPDRWRLLEEVGRHVTFVDSSIEAREKPGYMETAFVVEAARRQGAELSLVLSHISPLDRNDADAFRFFLHHVQGLDIARATVLLHLPYPTVQEVRCLRGGSQLSIVDITELLEDHFAGRVGSSLSRRKDLGSAFIEEHALEGVPPNPYRHELTWSIEAMFGAEMLASLNMSEWLTTLLARGPDMSNLFTILPLK